MGSPAELKGVLAGKRLFVTSGKGPTARVADLREFLKRFSTHDTLRLLGVVADQIEAAPRNMIMTLGEEPVPLHCLPYLALLSVEESSDLTPPSFGFCGLVYGRRGLEHVWFLRDGGMTAKELEQLVRMFHNLRDPISVEGNGDGDAGYECALRMGGAQFPYQGALNYLLPRTLLLYRDIWPLVPGASEISPCDDLMKLTGLELEQLLAFAKAFLARAEGGVFRPYKPEVLASVGSSLSSLLTKDAQEKFLTWISADYATIRAKAAKHVPPNELYDPYRFNPLLEHPAVRPDIQPVPVRSDAENAYLVPCTRLLLLRVTRGLYHDLLNLHMGQGKANPFKTAFGHVFQEYVGRLLMAALGESNVLREWRYGKGASIDTTDWLVIDGDRVVLIEVKQSAQFLPSKMWGRLDDLRNELKRTLGHAIDQLCRFERDLSQGAQGLERLRDIRKIERLIVTYDEVSWANWVLKEVASEVSSAPNEFPVHIASIDDLERMLGHCWNGSLFDLLQLKSSGTGGQAAMDFHDWLATDLDPDGKLRNPWLEGRYDEILAAWGLPPPSAS